MPLDGTRMGLDYGQLRETTESIGVGGISEDFVEPVFIAFAEPRINLYVYAVEILVAVPSPEIMDIPSLLGRDVLDRWHMTYNRSKKRLTFRVLSADYTVSIP